MSHDDFDFEPVRGLPRRLPPGERMLWQGAPDAGAFAFRFLKLPHLTGYFLALVGWAAISAALDGGSAREVTGAAAFYGALSLIALGLVRGYAELVARTTVYTLTDKRFVLRLGLALPISINLPFSRIDTAAMREAPDGTGEIALTLRRGERLAYFVLWPHTRGWRMSHPQPALRCVPEVRKVAGLLARALGGTAEAAAAPSVVPVAVDAIRPLAESAA